MTGIAHAAGSVSPIADPSRPQWLGKVGSWPFGIAALPVVLDLLGVDVRAPSGEVA